MLAWHTTSPISRTNSRRNGVLARLSDAQINSNTTRGSTPGLFDPTLGEGSERIPLPVPRRGQGVARRQQTVVVESSESEDTSEDENEEVSDNDEEEGSDDEMEEGSEGGQEEASEDDEEEGSDEVSESNEEADGEPESRDSADDEAQEDDEADEAETDDVSNGDANSEANADEESFEGRIASDCKDVGQLEGPPRDEEVTTTMTNSYSEEDLQSDVLPQYHSPGFGYALPNRTESAPEFVDEELFEALMSNEVLIQSTPCPGLLNYNAVGISASPTGNDLLYAVCDFKALLRLSDSDTVATGWQRHK